MIHTDAHKICTRNPIISNRNIVRYYGIKHLTPDPLRDWIPTHHRGLFPCVGSGEPQLLEFRLFFLFDRGPRACGGIGTFLSSGRLTGWPFSSIWTFPNVVNTAVNLRSPLHVVSFWLSWRTCTDEFKSCWFLFLSWAKFSKLCVLPMVPQLTWQGNKYKRDYPIVMQDRIPVEPCYILIIWLKFTCFSLKEDLGHHRGSK